VLPGNGNALVRIETRYTTRGLAGWLESKFAPRLLGMLYRDELARLATYAAGVPSSSQPAVFI
jgi:hypothetical protein